MTITALKAGSSKLHAVYIRPWEFKGWEDKNNVFNREILANITIEAADAPKLGSTFVAPPKK